MLRLGAHVGQNARHTEIRVGVANRIGGDRWWRNVTARLQEDAGGNGGHEEWPFGDRFAVAAL